MLKLRFFHFLLMFKIVVFNNITTRFKQKKNICVSYTYDYHSTHPILMFTYPCIQ